MLRNETTSTMNRKQTSQRVQARSRRRAVLCLELLEDRCVPAVIFDNNVGSLMQPVLAGGAAPDVFLAERFLPTQNATVNSATLTLANQAGSAGQGSLQLFADAGTLDHPGAPIGAATSFTLNSTSPTSVNIAINGSPLVTSDQVYWVVVHSGATSSTYFWES